MAITVLDSTDTAGILADAGITLDQPTHAAESQTETGEKKPEIKAADKPAEKKASETHEDLEGDEEEDEHGLTAADKQTLTKRMQKAVGKQHRMRKEAEEFAAAQYSERKLAEQRAALLEQELAALKGKAAPQTPVDTTSQQPKRENFAGEADYVDAMIQWGVDKRLAEKAEEDRQARAQRDRDAMMEAATARIARAAELIEDFAEVVGSVDTEVPPAIAGYMQKSDMFAELGYHLAKNPDLLVSLAKLPPDEQLVKIGRIESTLTPFEPRKEAPHGDKPSDAGSSDGKGTKPAPSQDTGIDLSKPRSKPAPVFAPLDTTGSAGIQKDSKDMNIRESIEDFAKRNKVNLGARKRH